MTKELEALEKVYYGSQGYGNCDENYKIVKQALHRLEAIDNAEPSEVLEELIDMIEYFTRLDYVEPIVRNEIHDKFKDIYWHKLPHLDSIKQALIKQQEPKQYLKWEDLKFTDERKTIKVLLNGEKYFVKYKKEYLFGYYEKVEITNGTFILCTLGSAMKQFFNDLHLERVEE